MKTRIIICLTLLAMTAGVSAQDSLQTYIAATVKNNPGMTAAYRAYKSLVMGACGAGQLNDPEVSVGIFPSGMQHANVKQLMTVSVMQMFPWFGTLKAGRQQQEWKAEAAYQKVREDAIALAYETQRRWYAMLVTRESIASVDSTLSLLADIKRVMLYQYKSPTMMKGAKMSDQLRVETEEQRLQEQRATLTDQLRTQQQQFNLLMHRDTESPVVLPPHMALRTMPVIGWDEVERNNPRLSQLAAEGHSYEAQEARAKGMGKPMIGIGLEYMLNGRIDMPRMESMNGNDMLMPMVKVTLPIYRKKIQAARHSAVLMKESTEAGRLQVQDNLRGQYLDIARRAQEALRKVELYKNQTDLNNRTINLMLAEYATGATSLTDILQTTRAKIDYALGEFNATAAYNMVVADYEKLASRYDYTTK